MKLQRLTVVGLGLLGGSVVRAASARKVAEAIVAVSRSTAGLAQARAAGVVDETTRDLADGVRDADLVVLCAPVGALPGLVRSAWSSLAPRAILTDVGSVKSDVVAAADACPRRADAAFVGGHPIAGSERSGFVASDPDLFEGRLTLLTPTSSTPPEAVERVTAFWEALGSHVRVITPEAHDRLLAAASHLPHLAAYGLVAVADADTLAVAGRGFGDTTRIAASAEGLWTDIFRGNREPLLGVLTRYRAVLDRWDHLIRAGHWDSLERELARARELRGKLP